MAINERQTTRSGQGGRRWLWFTLLLLVPLAISWIVTKPHLFDARYTGEPPPPRQDIVIRRDTWGVPHILATTDAGAVYGLAYAHAEDDFATIQQFLMIARGRSGEIAGAQGAKADFAYSLLRIRETVEQHYARDLSLQVRAVLNSYAEGLNRYAALHRDEIVAKGLFPVDGKDVVAGFQLTTPMFFGLGRTIGALVEGKPPPSEGAPQPQRGSNGFAISPRRSADGSTWLVSNSHQPWEGIGAWWEVQVQSLEGLDFSGGVLPGLPLPVAGHNPLIAFMQTLNRPDLIDVYRLVLDASGSHYRLDGRWLPLEERTVWLHVKFGPIVIPVPRTVHWSRHGPVIVNKAGAFAVRYAGMDDVRAIDQIYRLDRAGNYAEWSEAMRMGAIPSFNFVYADHDGHIAYVYNGAFPTRDAAHDWRSILPGDDSRLIWRTNVAWAALPKVVDPRSGYVFSANNAPWLSSGPGDNPVRTAFPSWLGVEDDMTNRAFRASELFEATPRMGEADIYRIKFDKVVDHRSGMGLFVLKVLAMDVHGDPELARGQALLAKWDWAFDGKNPGDALASEMLRVISDKSYVRDILPPPDLALRDAMHYVVDHTGRLDPPLSALMRIRRGTLDIPATGGPDVLRALVSYADPGEQPRITFGDCYQLVVRWDREGRLSASSVVPYGANTSHPNSRHYADQAPLFAREKLKPAWFSPADLRGHIERSYRPG